MSLAVGGKSGIPHRTLPLWQNGLPVCPECEEVIQQSRPLRCPFCALRFEWVNIDIEKTEAEEAQEVAYRKKWREKLSGKHADL